MSEQELIELGFDRVDILDEQSQNGYDYYYYQKELCTGLLLHTTDNIDVENDTWEIRSFDLPALLIIDRFHYEQFLEIMSNITC